MTQAKKTLFIVLDDDLEKLFQEAQKLRHNALMLRSVEDSTLDQLTEDPRALRAMLEQAAHARITETLAAIGAEIFNAYEQAYKNARFDS